MKSARHSEKGLSTRDKILHEARSTLVAKGYEGLVLRELAEKIGIKLGNLQYYFKTKDLLVLQVFQDAADEDLLTLSDDAPEPIERFRKMVKSLVSRWRGDSGVLFSLLATLGIHHPGFKKLYRSIYGDFYAALDVMLAELNPDLPADARATKVRLITALIDGSSMQVQVGGVNDYLRAVQLQAENIALK